MRRIIYDGDSFYEIDEECIKRKKVEKQRKEMERQLENSDRNTRRQQSNQQNK